MMLDRSQSLINSDTALELLDDFSFQSSLEILSSLDLASGKFPRSGQVIPWSTLTDQNPVIPDEHGTNHFQHGRPIAHDFCGGQGSRKDDHCRCSAGH